MIPRLVRLKIRTEPKAAGCWLPLGDPEPAAIGLILALSWAVFGLAALPFPAARPGGSCRRLAPIQGDGRQL